MRSLIVLTTLALIILSQNAGPIFASESVLDTVRDRGYVKCSIGNRQVGDTRIGEEGFQGFFPEFCRVVALAVFGDRNAVEMSPTLIRVGFECPSSEILRQPAGSIIGGSGASGL